MKTQADAVHAAKNIRTVRDDSRTNNPRVRKIHDVRFRDVFVTHSRSTR